MPVAIPRSLVEYILLGPVGDRRQLQDSPILGDVWVAYANDPGAAQELLITPHDRASAGTVAIEIDSRIVRDPGDFADVAPLQSVVAARLYFEEVLRVVVPMTQWWHSRRIQDALKTYQAGQDGAERLNGVVSTIVSLAEQWRADFRGAAQDDLMPAFDRLIALAGLFLWARGQEAPAAGAAAASETALADALDALSAQEVSDLLFDLFDRIQEQGGGPELVRLVSMNRAATAALDRSVASVKADAARALFDVDCGEIAWAVIDSGVQGNHPAFAAAAGSEFRVKGSFDFSNIRKIVSLDNLRILARDAPDSEVKARRLRELLRDELLHKPSAAQATRLLRSLADDARHKRAIHWEFVRPFVEIKPDTRPKVSDHGTHVAGIIGARKRTGEADEDDADTLDGMCPDIQLYDFRVLAPEIRETEFAIIAALQFIRYLNARTDFTAIHGANLSLSIPHDVRNYACGRTPVCVECERLVDSGVVVVAAAGNLGYQSFTTKEGSYEGYAAFSITDPGNADGVITVGATHRHAPHTYGVSFFSSRGPTGDGRMKPDLVAPGERVRAPFREGWGDLDGTSMAAPHVSGAAAMLMARYSELIGQPRRIKQILCDSATDLGRERSFQGRGMLDVLRALQSI